MHTATPITRFTSASLKKPGLSGYRHWNWTHPANVVVETYADKAGNTSLDTYHLLKDADTGAVYAEGYAKIVWMDRKTRKSTSLPDTLRALAAK
jgi:acyl-CoA thioesterase FadM